MVRFITKMFSWLLNVGGPLAYVALYRYKTSIS